MTLNSVIRGLNSYPRHLPTKRGNRIYLYCHCNLVINEELKIVEQLKPAVRDFVNFGDYRDFVANQIAAIVSNARDSRRNVKYEPITTISSRYDSPACAVFARENGCKKALTFVQARGEEKNGNEDSGAEIAACLGMSVEAFDRKDYLRESGFPEAEFFGGASGAMMSPLANQLEAKVVFSGHHGDKVWDRTYHEGCENLVREDPYMRRFAFQDLFKKVLARHQYHDHINLILGIVKIMVIGNCDQPELSAEHEGRSFSVWISYGS